jgi:hypothetical protein
LHIRRFLQLAEERPVKPFSRHGGRPGEGFGSSAGFTSPGLSSIVGVRFDSCTSFQIGKRLSDISIQQIPLKYIKNRHNFGDLSRDLRKLLSRISQSMNCAI